MSFIINDWVVETVLEPIAINCLKEKLKRDIRLSSINFNHSDDDEERYEEEKVFPDDDIK